MKAAPTEAGGGIAGWREGGHGVLITIHQNTTVMTYQLDGNSILFALNRRDILDITPGDTISLKGLPGTKYTWTAHDAEFMENNPDDDIYLELERVGDNQYKARGIHLEVARREA